MLVIVGVVVLVAAFFVLDLGQYLSLSRLKDSRDALSDYAASSPVKAAFGYLGLYVAVTGLSLPGAAVLTLVGGALFGLLWGTVLVSVAATLGATIAFLVARFLLRAWVRDRFGSSLEAIDRGVERDGAFYLFALRLVPAFPYFVINLLMGLTSIRVPTFALVSQLGMLPGTLVFVNAGTQLAELDSIEGILSVDVVLSFCLLAVFPFIARRIVESIRVRRALAGFPRPQGFERDLVVVGAGSAGLVSALIGSTVRAKVTLIERERMGGDCLNTGCVPSKSLIRTARFLAGLTRSASVGVRRASAEFDFNEVMDRVRSVIEQIEPNDSVDRYESLGVECVAGDARLVSPWEVSIGDRVITTRRIVLATGARPFVPPIPGLDAVPHVTSDSVWGLRQLPRRLLVLGGGAIGCELAQCFARLGSEVTAVEMLPRLLAAEDPEFSAVLTRRFENEGLRVLTGYRAREFRGIVDGYELACEPVEDAGTRGPVVVAFDLALVAVGRRPDTEGLGLAALGIPVRENGTVETDDSLRTRIPTIYACGDVAGPLQFTHVASHQAWYATVNSLFGELKRWRVSYEAVPRVTFTEPEVARVGLNEAEARAQGVGYEVTRFPLAELDRALADAAPDGELKVLTAPGKDRILGATVIGEHAGELIAELTLAMRHRLGLGKILGTIHAYPTWMEANRMLAGRWRRAHAPERVLGWLERYHAWRRSG